MPVRRYGSWPSELSAELVARAGGRSFAGVWPQEHGLSWLEYRSDEGGRGVVVARRGDGEPADVTPAAVNVRTRVHEYGGGACWLHGETVFYSDFADSRLYRQDAAGAPPVALTPEPATPHALRYADGCVVGDGATVVCVRERHDGDAVSNDLVALAADGSAQPRSVFSGTDFVASPTPDRDERRLAWVSWDHPQMPWDATRLWLGTLAPDGSLTDARVVAGSAPESILQPSFGPDGALHFCSDRSGWWNLYRLDPGGEVEALTQLDDGEIGAPSSAVRHEPLRVPRRRADRLRRHARRDGLPRAARSAHRPPGGARVAVDRVRPDVVRGRRRATGLRGDLAARTARAVRPRSRER